MFAVAMPPISIIEHIVLFKVRDSPKAAAMVAGQRSLASLASVSHLAAGPILSSSETGFTHLLHARYLSSADLAAYAVHPSHLALIEDNSPIIEENMAIDWVAHIDAAAIVPPPGSAMRFLLAKPRDGIQAAEVVKAIDGVRASFPATAGQVSYGENFSPARAKGYEVGFVLVFSGVEEMEEIERIMEKIGPLIESAIVVDFEVPSSGL